MHIQRTGVPEGNLVQAGTVPFWGDEISKSILIFEGRDKAVLYNNATKFRVGVNSFFPWDWAILAQIMPPST